MFNLKEYDKIFYYKDVIQNPYELVGVIEDTDSFLNEHTSITKWKNWVSSDGSYEFGHQKFITDKIKEEKNIDLLYINNTIKNAIEEVSKDYANKFNIDLGYLTPISISKYSKSKEMGKHVDSYGDDREPVLSVVVYLNDNYVGGDLYFVDQQVSIKPEAGSIVVFPSVEPYYHESRKIIAGTKYMSPGFWYKN